MRDLQPFKNSLMGLTYEEKIQMSEWLHTQIDFERAEAVKKKSAEVSSKLDGFLNKAIEKTKETGSSLLSQFREATSSNSSNNQEEKK